MLNKIIGFSIRNKLIIGLSVLALILWGTYELTRLPIDAVPDITDNQVQVITVSPSLGAPDIERLITFPIEQSCSNVPGLKQIRSFSRFGLSLVTIVFNDEADLYWARQQIAERLQQVQQEIPDGIGRPEMAPVSTGLGEIYQYVLRPKKGYEQKYTPMDLRTLQDWIVRRRLLGTPGVAEVASFGGQLKQYEIAVSPEQLNAYHISIGDVFNALAQNNQNTGGAYIEKGPTVLYIRSEGLTGSLEDIGQITVKMLSNGMPLLIRDVAEVRLGSAIRYGAMTYNTQGEVAGAVVMMLKGENSSVVVKRVKDKVADIQKDLPEGVVIEPFLDRTKMVNSAISTVENNLMEGALIVVLVLVFFLGNLRAGLIVSSVIPLAMLFAIILMNKTGVGGNLMSLGAIDFGLIVDGSVIVVEAILHRFAHSKSFRGIGQISQQQMDEEVGHSTGGTINAAVFSQIIILIVYLPILSLQGIEGKMFKPMAYTIAYAILGAFLLSVTYVPMMSALCLNKKLNHKETLADKMVIAIERRYQPLLKRILQYPKTVLSVTLALFALAVLLLSGMGGEFIPQIEEGDFAVETRLLTGSNLNNTIDYTQKASGILLRQFPEVQKVVTKIGSAEIPTDPMPFEAADMMVILKDKKEWTSAHSFKELSDKMTKALSVIPGITVGFQFPVQMRFNELMTGARQDVVCKIFGDNLDSLSQLVHRLGQIVQTVPGAINIYEETVTGMPQVVIRYNRAAMASYGLNIADINRVVNTAFAGQSAGQVYEGERRFDLVVRLDTSARRNLEDIRNLLVPTASGTQVPLYQVAAITEEEGVNQIQRENTRRRIVLGFNVGGRDVQGIVQELQQKVQAQLKLPAGYRIVYGGSFENLNAAKQRLGLVVPIALFLIFLLLYFAFRSVKLGLLIYTAIPLSAIGGILALWLRGMPFSISAGVGFIALFGVAVLNGILLVSECNRLKQEGWADMTRIVLHATKSKLRAVLMTALVPSLGFIPMALSTGAGGEVQKPLATVVIGGLIVSTLLTLFVLPLCYVLLEQRGRRLKLKKVTALIVFVLLGSTLHIQAQPLSLSAALQLAERRNAGLEASRLNSRYYHELVRSAADLPYASLNAEYGKMNSVFNDTRFALVQTIPFPTVIGRRKKVYEAQAAIGDIQAGNQLLLVAAEVKSAFYALLLLQEKKEMLHYADSIYAAFADKAAQQYELGATDILEKASAENQRAQIAFQLQQLLNETLLQGRRLQYLLHADTIPELQQDSIVYRKTPLLPDTSLERAPQLQLLAHELTMTRNQHRLEKSRLLPALSLGYNNMSIIGWQTTSVGTEQYFNGNQRFSSVSVGIDVPLFFSAQRARIRAAGTAVQQKQLEQEQARLQLEASMAGAAVQYTRLYTQLQTYRRQLLPNARLVMAAAGRRLELGEIDYLQWTLLINQAFGVWNSYYDTVQQLNELVFELEKNTGNNN